MSTPYKFGPGDATMFARLLFTHWWWVHRPATVPSRVPSFAMTGETAS